MEVSYFARNIYEMETLTTGLCYIFLENNIVWFWRFSGCPINWRLSGIIQHTFIVEGFFINSLQKFLKNSALFNRNCISQRFIIYFDRWLSRYQNIYPLTKYYYIIERVCSIYRLLILFISTFSFLLLLYSVSWRYRRDYLYTSADILF